MEKSQLNLRRNILWPILLLLAVGVILIIFDRERIILVLAKADWQYVPRALVFIACSYGLVSYSYAILAHQVGIRLGWRELSLTYFVTAVMNRVVRSGGVAGFSVRCLIMKQYGVSMNDTLSSSLIHVLIGSLVMLAMLPVGSLYVYFSVPVSTALEGLLVFMTAISLLFSLGAVAVLLSEQLRDRVIEVAAGLAKKIVHRDITPALHEFNLQVSLGIRLLRQSPLHCGEIILLLFVEWWANVIALSFCLNAFGASLPIGAVAALYVVGIMAGVITALPGGFGVQEGVMTLMAVAQGTSFEQAILAMLLYRVVHSIIPYLVSPLFYLHLLHEQRPEVVA